MQGKYCLSDGNNTTERNDDELRYLLAPAIGLSEEPMFSCMAGVARGSLWLGDMHRGIRIAQKSDSEQLLKECAKILESLKQVSVFNSTTLSLSLLSQAVQLI